MGKHDRFRKFMNGRKLLYIAGGCVAIIFAIVDIILGISFDMPIASFLGGAIIIFIVYVLFKSITKLNNNYKNVVAIVDIAEDTYERYREQLVSSGFKSSQHLSAFGYRWTELRNMYNIVDNFHLEIDETHKKVAYYALYIGDGDSYFKIYKFSDLLGVRLVSNESDGLITSYYVEITVADSEVNSLILPVNDNQGFRKDSERAKMFEQQAEQLIAIIKDIINKGKRG